ncbi:DUF5681 domain-containing protein [Tsuneonella rigui]|uniref:DUF5681 domain-containing protein n=1 Tax=Tsuneonella rigui TaxID=1708790 RepID=UPI001F49F5BB|nr:DUF5681 domain-containing protein [Tsuneonella rigui]
MSEQTPSQAATSASPLAVLPDGRWQKGVSGNPKGRPRGILDKRSKITRALMDDGPAIARVVIEQALEGDLHACSLVLSRIAPALRSEGLPVTFDFDAAAPIARQIEQVLEAMAAGAVAPEVGKQIIDAIDALSSARAVEELEARIITLEARQI